MNLDALDPASNNVVHLLNLHVGDEILITVSENPSTGYSWQKSTDGTEGGVFEIASTEWISSADSELMVGAGGERQININIVGAGKDLILMDYARAWEFTGFDSENLVGVYQIHLWSQ